MKRTTGIVVLIWIAVAVLFVAYSGVDKQPDTTIVLIDSDGDTLVSDSVVDGGAIGFVVDPVKEEVDSSGGRGEQTCIKINSADSQTLTTLPGIGPVLAKRILEHRELIGSFKDTQQLLEVKGIGPLRLQKIAGLICF